MSHLAQSPFFSSSCQSPHFLAWAKGVCSYLKIHFSVSFGGGESDLVMWHTWPMKCNQKFLVGLKRYLLSWTSFGATSFSFRWRRTWPSQGLIPMLRWKSHPPCCLLTKSSTLSTCYSWPVLTRCYSVPCSEQGSGNVQGIHRCELRSPDLS